MSPKIALSGWDLNHTTLERSCLHRRLTFILPDNLMGTESDSALLLKYHSQYKKKTKIKISAQLQKVWTGP
jgi:hypothetical protein